MRFAFMIFETNYRWNETAILTFLDGLLHEGYQIEGVNYEPKLGMSLTEVLEIAREDIKRGRITVHIAQSEGIRRKMTDNLDSDLRVSSSASRHKGVVLLETYMGKFTEYSQEENLENLVRFLDLGKLIYAKCRAKYGFGGNAIATFGRQKKDVEDQLKAGELVELGQLGKMPWCVFLGPEMASEYVSKRIKNLPCWRIEDLSDGGVLLVATPTIEVPDETAREIYNYLFQHCVQ